MSFEPGSLIADKYEIVSVLGEGGMGVVYQARHRELGVLVAIKLIRPEVMADAEAVMRFSREAQAAAMLSGEHVARVLDVGKLEDGRPFMVMEFLNGSDLGAILEKRQRLPLGEAVNYVVQACEALAEAHAAGVVHRDLKPANLFVVKVAGRQCVKLVDFGISRFVKPDEVRVTQTQTAFGTPLYMAPESIRSAKLADARSDIWALGVILYELVSGSPPFLGDTPTSVAVAITVDKQRQLSQLGLDVPPEIDAIIAWALEKDPAKRPQTAGDLAEALRPYLDPGRVSLAGAGPASQRASLPGVAPGGQGFAPALPASLARTEQTTRTGGPISSDVVRERKTKVAIFVAVAVAGFAAATSITVLIRGGRGASPSHPAATAAQEQAAGQSTGAPPAISPTTADATASPPAHAAAPPHLSAPATAAAAGPQATATGAPAPATATAEPAQPSATAAPATAAPATAAPATAAPTAPKPIKEAPASPGGNPLRL